MKMKQIGMVSHFPIWEFVNYPSPLVFVKVGDRQIDLVSVKRINGKFFHTNLGLFELDGEYENTMGGQPFYIFNLQNGKPISLKNIEKIQRLYRENKTKELNTVLETISREIEEGMLSQNFDEDGDEIVQYKSPLNALNKILDTKTEFLDDNDIKFIINYKFTDMSDLKIFNFKKISERKPDWDVSRKIPTIIPLTIVCIGGIGAVLITAFSGIGGMLRGIYDPREPNLLLGLQQYLPDMTAMMTKLVGLFS